MSSIAWLHSNPHIMHWRVSAEQIDHYQHVNNVEYMRKLEKVSWQHSQALGLSLEDYKVLDRGMAIKRHEIDYLAAARLDEDLLCATWVTKCDGRLSIVRQFQIVREADQTTILTATTDYVCIALSSGKPKRMPGIFADTYGQACINGQPA